MEKRRAVSNLAQLEEYKEGDVKQKRLVICSIYREKLFFYGFRYCTAKVNEAGVDMLAGPRFLLK